jgi:hypothetical protein
MIKPNMLVVALLALAAAGCGEKPQTGSTVKKADTKAWASAPGAFAAPSWKGGDEAAWDAQMRARAQGQNEYVRIAAVPAAAPTKTP